MPISVNPASQLYTFLDACLTGGSTSNAVYRGDYIEHSIQVSGSSGAVDFVLYASNDASVWTAIRDQADIDSAVAAYDNSNPTAVIRLSGCFPYFKVVRGAGATGSAFTATIFSTGGMN